MRDLGRDSPGARRPERRLGAADRRRLWGQLALTGLFNMGLFQIFLIAGLALLGPSRTPIIVYTMPTWSALLAVFVPAERITLRIAFARAEPGRRRPRHQPGNRGPARRGDDSHPAGGDLLRHRHRSPPKRMAVSGRHHDQCRLADPGRHRPVLVVWLVFARDAYFHPEQVRPGRSRLADPGVQRARLCLLVPYHSGALPAAVASLTTLVVPCVGFASSAC